MAAYKSCCGCIKNLFVNLYMTVLEIKSEIKRTVDQLPENSLVELLDLLKDLQQYPSVDIASVYQLKQIIAENRQLLEKLAQ